ncbi:hypothetical protein FRC17_004442 [Serendipita sp. 399]|nr:hypothetical protein FRC17_004442 [Serendipita sp. 399]
MPPRARSPATRQFQAYHPSADTATFRDLLLFEERLKRNAGILKRKKARYQIFVLLVFLSDVLLETDLFILPLNLALEYYLLYTQPDIDWRRDELYFHLPPYVKTGGLFILGVTLFLFFASGMYSERVGYANKYVPHANKALRSFNMYLNVRTQPLPSRLSRMASTIGLGSLFSTSSSATPSSPVQQQQQPYQRSRTSSSPSSSRESSPYPYAHAGNTTGRRAGSVDGGGGGGGIIPQIPPSSNPRGELIFSSVVHREFREGYERYRESYEKKMQAGGGGVGVVPSVDGGGFVKRMIRWMKGGGAVGVGGDNMMGGMGVPSGFGTPGFIGTDTPVLADGYSPGSMRGRAYGTTTPSGSRRSSPAPSGSPGSVSGGTSTPGSGNFGSISSASPSSIGKKGSKRRAGAGARISRQGTPLLEVVENIRMGGSGGEDQTGVLMENRNESRSGLLIEVPLLGSGIGAGRDTPPGTPPATAGTSTPPMIVGRGLRRRGRKGSALGDLG